MAYDELLSLVIGDDFDIDRLATDYPRLCDEQPAALRAAPGERRVALAIAAKHDVLLCEDYSACYSFAMVRAWLAFHVQLLRAGRSLLLLGPAPDPAGAPWATHGLSLAGALIRICGQLFDLDVSVRPLQLQHPLLKMERHSPDLSHLLWRVGRSCASPPHPLCLTP